jgi:hypothetical protein
VLAPWAYGFWLNYIAERPNTASPNLLLPEEVEGVRASLRVLFEKDEGLAVELAKHSGVRYVVAVHIHDALESMVGILGHPLNRYRITVGPPRMQAVRFKDQFFQILNNRMLLFDGRAVADLGSPALDRFRLVYDSPHRLSPCGLPTHLATRLETERVSYLKIFELVEGAFLKARARPLSLVRAEVMIRTNGGREFVYSTRARCDEEGEVTLRLPYATRARPDPFLTVAVGGYRIEGGGLSETLNVTEDDVRLGRVVSLRSTRHSQFGHSELSDVSPGGAN